MYGFTDEYSSHIRASMRNVGQTASHLSIARNAVALGCEVLLAWVTIVAQPAKARIAQ
jgi:hypothetical protein